MSSKIRLRDFTNSSLAFGNDQGRLTLQKLQKYVDDHNSQKIFSISMEGIEATDASFPRESVVSLIKMLKGEKGFYLYDFPSDTNDMFDNWNYAAQAKSQSIIVKVKKSSVVIGPEPTETARELLDFILSKHSITTSEVAVKFDITAQNASARLKKLYDMGLILGSKQTADSGGLEFVYTPIK